MEITFGNRTVTFDQPWAKLPVLLKNRRVMVPWGRRPNEAGALPAMPYVADYLLNAGLFDGFKQQLVPILAEEFKTADDRGYLVPDVVQPGRFIQGLMIELNGEKRVYVVGVILQSQSGYYVTPKMMRN